MRVCICLPVGRSVHRASYESVYVCRWVCVHRILCVCLCICQSPDLEAGSGFSAGVGGQEAGGTLLRKSTHKDLAGWAFLPASLPRLKPQQLGPSNWSWWQGPSPRWLPEKREPWGYDCHVPAPPALKTDSSPV